MQSTDNTTTYNGRKAASGVVVAGKPIEPSDILTPQELAERLKVPVSWVYAKSRAGGKHDRPLPLLRCGRYLRFSWLDVSAWLRSGSAASDAPEPR